MSCAIVNPSAAKITRAALSGKVTVVLERKKSQPVKGWLSSLNITSLSCIFFHFLRSSLAAAIASRNGLQEPLGGFSQSCSSKSD
jgi:hypothetical protein